MVSLRLEGATIVDGSGTPAVSDGTILVEGDRLAFVGARSAAPPVTGERVLDVRGKTVLPGLTDLHVHSTFDADLRAYLERGITSIRYAGVNQDAVAAVARRVEVGEIPGPRVFSCGPMLDKAPPAYPEWTSVVETPSAAAAEAQRLIVEEHVDALIATQRITPDLLQAIVETAHQHGIPVTGQLLWTDGAEAARIGIDGLENTTRIFASQEYPPERLYQYRSIAHRLAMTGHAWATIDWDATAHILDAMATAQVRYCPTMTVLLACLGDMDEPLRADPAYQGFGERETGTWSAFRSRISSEWSDEDREAWRRGMDNWREWIRRYHELGGSIVAGTDMQFGAIALGMELRQLQGCGLSAMEAIVAATGEAARALRVEREQGTLEVGKRADLVVLDGDPLTDLAALQRVVHVVKNGDLVGS